jgi:membrane protease YdiL (CAAX protease family)
VASTEPLSIVLASLGLAVEAAVCAAVGVAVLRWQLRAGVVATGQRESGGRGAIKSGPPSSVHPPVGRRLLPPIAARELRLLSRDRNFLVQTLLLPILIAGAQVFLSSQENLLVEASRDPEHLAAIAFGISAYALMFSAFQTLNAEGRALWILYSVPRSLESILRQKATFWGTACLCYPVVIFSCAVAASGTVSPRLLGLALVVVLGIVIYAVVATALGVFACDPLGPEVQRRLRPGYLYLYMLLGSIYVYAIYAREVLQQVTLIVLTATLAIALWQKACDRLPYLLDPAASPPPRVSVSDGLIAALLFFVIQALVLLLYAPEGQRPTGPMVLISFSVAGGLTSGLARFALWRSKAQGIPRVFGRGARQALAWGLAGGLTAGLGFLIYLELAARTSLLDQVRETVPMRGEALRWELPLALVAAPSFEEFIFRGLIFGGLRRAWPLAPSVFASAAIFALVHSPPAIVPVFALGIITALVFERTRLLIAPMVVHAIYNAVVIGFR